MLPAPACCPRTHPRRNAGWNAADWAVLSKKSSASKCRVECRGSSAFDSSPRPPFRCANKSVARQPQRNRPGSPTPDCRGLSQPVVGAVADRSSAAHRAVRASRPRRHPAPAQTRVAGEACQRPGGCARRDSARRIQPEPGAASTRRRRSCATGTCPGWCARIARRTRAVFSSATPALALAVNRAVQ